MKFISYYEKSEGSSFVKKEVLHSLIRLLFECKREYLTSKSPCLGQTNQHKWLFCMFFRKKQQNNLVVKYLSVLLQRTNNMENKRDLEISFSRQIMSFNLKMQIC